MKETRDERHLYSICSKRYCYKHWPGILFGQDGVADWEVKGLTQFPWVMRARDHGTTCRIETRRLKVALWVPNDTRESKYSEQRGDTTQVSQQQRRGTISPIPRGLGTRLEALYTKTIGETGKHTARSRTWETDVLRNPAGRLTWNAGCEIWTGLLPVMCM